MRREVLADLECGAQFQEGAPPGEVAAAGGGDGGGIAADQDRAVAHGVMHEESLAIAPGLRRPALDAEMAGVFGAGAPAPLVGLGVLRHDRGLDVPLRGAPGPGEVRQPERHPTATTGVRQGGQRIRDPRGILMRLRVAATIDATAETRAAS